MTHLLQLQAGGQICSELAAPIALASVDVKMQGLFVSKMLESVPVEKRKQCAVWEAKGLPCLLLVDARHKVRSGMLLSLSRCFCHYHS